MSTIFVTGPTGVLGRATIPLFVASGHAVLALSRSEENDAAIRALGAQPVRGDLFDPASLRAAVASADAILHLATRIPPGAKVRQRQAWAENDRIRAEGTRNLVDAALQAGTRTFVYPSFAYVYPDRGDAWIVAATTEVDPVAAVQSTLAAEDQVGRFAAAGGDVERRGIAMRLGGLYGPTLPSTRDQLQLARRGCSLLGGSNRAFTPLLWIEDAATALVAAVERAPSGLYDVVDDEPLGHGELNRLLAASVGRRRLIAPPLWLLRLAAGPVGPALSRSLRVSNRRFREATGWAPSIPSGREGFARIAETLGPPPKTYVPLGVTASLWVLLLISLGVGLQQQFLPRSFYDNFPGFGMHWVSLDGPFNEHVLRDLGGANLALAVLVAFALLRPSAGLVRAVATAVLVAQVPHFIYHAVHLGLFPSLLDQVLQTLSLTLPLLVAAYLLIRASGITEAAPAGSPRTGPGAPVRDARLVVSPR